MSTAEDMVDCPWCKGSGNALNFMRRSCRGCLVYPSGKMPRAVAEKHEQAFVEARAKSKPLDEVP